MSTVTAPLAVHLVRDHSTTDQPSPTEPGPALPTLAEQRAQRRWLRRFRRWHPRSAGDV